MNSKDMQACSDAVRSAEGKVAEVLHLLLTTLAALTGTPHAISSIDVHDNGSINICTTGTD
ncbi:hypothetical protein [Azospirillum sp. B4]|uniref:hypothetical protein n=1 Tax=Azospirillum sp. B4 TaxID=95605 RepID=UPI0005CAEC05|nr:hypothetical protein [Azospirillum sp. B4]